MIIRTKLKYVRTLINTVLLQKSLPRLDTRIENVVEDKLDDIIRLLNKFYDK